MRLWKTTAGILHDRCFSLCRRLTVERWFSRSFRGHPFMWVQKMKEISKLVKICMSVADNAVWRASFDNCIVIYKVDLCVIAWFVSIEGTQELTWDRILHELFNAEMSECHPFLKVNGDTSRRRLRSARVFQAKPGKSQWPVRSGALQDRIIHHTCGSWIAPETRSYGSKGEAF
jgi:hypothetical protein